MLNILRSNAPATNPDFTEQPRTAGESNVAWLARVDPKGVRIILLGGRDHTAFRLRVAQAHARHDMTPSHWSHCALVADGGFETATHVAVDPRGGLVNLIADNGVEEVRMRSFEDPIAFPNIAVLNVGDAKPEAVSEALARFRLQRSSTDCIELALAWLGFICGVGRSPNPLLDGLGIPSAVMVETIMAASGVELTPGLPNRSSCPEGIWQAARWWHAFHIQAKRGGALKGAWTVEHMPHA